jgi:hypothetical protein
VSKKPKYRSYLYYNFYSGDIPPVANSRFPSHSISFFASHNADFVINNQVAQCCKCCLSSGGDNSANPTPGRHTQSASRRVVSDMASKCNNRGPLQVALLEPSIAATKQAADAQVVFNHIAV